MLDVFKVSNQNTRCLSSIENTSDVEYHYLGVFNFEHILQRNGTNLLVEVNPKHPKNADMRFCVCERNLVLDISSHFQCV